MPRRLTAIPLALALAAASALSIAAPAHAETLNVNTTQDVNGASGCTAVLCTLRSALGVATTNGTAETDTIVLPAGMYALNAQLPGLNVPPSQTGIVIRGAGANSTTIQATSAVRVLTVGSGAGVTLNDLTLSGGEVTAGRPAATSRSADAAAVTLERVRVTGGTAQQGGGIAASGAGGPTSLTIRQSLIDGNNASGAALTAAGGGLYIAGSTAPVTVTVTDSTIAGNSRATARACAITQQRGWPAELPRRHARPQHRPAPARRPGVGGIYSGNATVQLPGLDRRPGT